MLKSVKLRNFMGFSGEHTMEFHNTLTHLKAKNGKGKTSLATAILWAMFNCDYSLKSNPAVRNNVIKDESDVEVELVFDDDGRETSFRKVQKRKRDKDDHAKYADTNSYYVNDVSCTMKSYNERLGGNINNMLMGVNINAFLSNKQEELRAYLFSKIEDMTDYDVAAGNENLSELAILLQKYTLEEIAAKNKRLISDNAKILPIKEGEIKATEAVIQERKDIDVSDLELQKNQLAEQIADIEEKIDDSEKLIADRKRISDNIMELKFKQGDLMRKAKTEFDAKRQGLEDETDKLKRQLQRIENDHESHKQEQRIIEGKIEKTTAAIKELQSRWKAEKDREFDDSSLICPYCGQEYPQEKKEALKADFESHKAAEIKCITDDGEAANKQLVEDRDQLKEVESVLAEDAQEIEKLKELIAAAEEKLKAIVPVDATQTEEYKALTQEIAEKEKAIGEEWSGDNARQELKAQRIRLMARKEDIILNIAKSEVSDFETKLEQLIANVRLMEQQKADAQRILDMVDALEQAKNAALTDKVNGLFRRVKFKLYEFNKSGGYKNVCIPTIDGKAITDNEANKALKIIAKIDICTAIQRLEGFDLPIILDDGESLDSENLARVAEMTDRQLIVFSVSDDEKLMCK